MKYAALKSPLGHSPRVLFTTLLAAGAIASPAARAATFSQAMPVITITSNATVSNKTSTGYTVADSGSTGDVSVTTTGLQLTYAVVSGSERSIIDNVEDITGAGIQLNRYLSFTLEPANVDALAGYSDGYVVSLTSITRPGTFLEAGGHFEIRTSMDNFASTLAVYDTTTTNTLIPVAPGLSSITSLINANGTVTSTDAPLEIRMYTWYDQPGATGYLGDSGDTLRFNYTVTTVPEPSGVMLLGVAGIVPLLRRRRK